MEVWAGSQRASCPCFGGAGGSERARLPGGSGPLSWISVTAEGWAEGGPKREPTGMRCPLEHWSDSGG